MDALTAIAAIVSVVVTEACTLCSLWLRLRWNNRRDQSLYRHAVATAQLLTGPGRLTFEEHRIDGGSLCLQLVSAPAAKTGDAV